MWLIRPPFVLQHVMVHCRMSKVTDTLGFPGGKNDVIARNCVRKTAINVPNCAVFKTLYLLDCAIQ